MEPGSVVIPRKVQGLGPLQISFCRVASKAELSGVMVFVTTPQPPEPFAGERRVRA